MANESIDESVSTGANRLTEARQAIVGRTKECAEATDAYVRENPWLAIAVGAGIGLLLGVLITRD